MSPPLYHEYHHHDDPLLARSRRKVLWHHATVVFGLCLLLVGYTLLAVTPDTPSDWVLIRVAAGFALLFIGFGLAILPWLTRKIDDDQ